MAIRFQMDGFRGIVFRDSVPALEVYIRHGAGRLGHETLLELERIVNERKEIRP